MTSFKTTYCVLQRIYMYVMPVLIFDASLILGLENAYYYSYTNISNKINNTLALSIFSITRLRIDSYFSVDYIRSVNLNHYTAAL